MNLRYAVHEGWQLNDDRCAHRRRRALDSNFAAVKLGNLFHERKTETQSTSAARRVARLTKWIERMGHELGRHALARVGHDELDGVANAPNPGRNDAAGRRELDRVRQKIPDHL